jgi:DegV family protein with EDD domain
MSRVAIVTDTSAHIPKQLVQEYDIKLVPTLINLDNKSYRDTIDIRNPTELFELVKKSSRFPTTSVPPPAEYVEVYRQLSQKTDDIFSVSVTSKLSGCFNSALQAKEIIKGELSDINIEVFDSRTTIGAMGFIVLAAARAAASGQDMAAVIKVAEDMRSKVNMLGIFDTLSYLARGGRISKAAAMAGNMLSMKPISGISTSLGVPTVLAKPRTRQKAVKVLLEIVKQRVETTSPVHFMVEHICAPEAAEGLKGIVQDQFNCAEVFTYEYHPVGSLIAGPGYVGLSFYQE